jgi:hypothetical protein
MQRRDMVRELRETPLEQSDRIIVALCRLTYLCSKVQVVDRHWYACRCRYEVFCRARVITLPCSDKTETGVRFAMIGRACQHALQQTRGFVESAGRIVLLRLRQRGFEIVIHANLT